MNLGPMKLHQLSDSSSRARYSTHEICIDAVKTVIALPGVGTQRRLATLIGAHSVSVNDWVQGRARPSQKYAMRMTWLLSKKNDLDFSTIHSVNWAIPLMLIRGDADEVKTPPGLER